MVEAEFERLAKSEGTLKVCAKVDSSKGAPRAQGAISGVYEGVRGMYEGMVERPCGQG